MEEKSEYAVRIEKFFSSELVARYWMQQISQEPSFDLISLITKTESVEILKDRTGDERN